MYDALLALNTARIGGSIRRACRRLGFEKPVVVNALHPTIGRGLLGKLDEQATVYYAYDEIGAETWSKAHGAPAEREFLRKADAVVVSSAGLLEAKKPLNPACFLVENGVDTSRWGRDAAKSVADLLLELEQSESTLTIENDDVLRCLRVAKMRIQRPDSDQCLVEAKQILPGGRERQLGRVPGKQTAGR